MPGWRNRGPGFHPWDTEVRLDWRGVLGIVISVLLLWWVLRGVDVAAVWAGIRGMHVGWFTAAVAVTSAGFILRAVRWKVLLDPIRPGTAFRSRFAAVCIGFMGNNLLPARAGEFARVYAFSRLEPVTVSGALGSLVVERFLDGMMILLLLAAAMATPGFPSEVMVAGRSVGAAVGTLSVLLLAAMLPVVLILVWPRPVVRVAEWVAHRIPGGKGEVLVLALEAFLAGLASLRSARYLVPALLWSLAFWLWHSWAFWLGFRAFGIEAGFAAALFLNGILAFFVAVPSSPGFFGTFHAGAVVALSVYGIAEDRILSFAFGQHLGGFIPVTLLGLWYAWRLGLSLREVGRSEARVEAGAAGVRSEEPGGEPSPIPAARGPGGRP